MISIGTIIYNVVGAYLAYALGDTAVRMYKESHKKDASKHENPIITKHDPSIDDGVEEAECSEVE